MNDVAISHLGKRKVSRLRVRLPAQLTLADHTHRAVLRDLSAHGAMMITSKPMTLGANVVLRWGGLEAFGKIWRVDDNLSGMSFEEAIPWSWLLTTRNKHDAMRWTVRQAQDWIAETQQWVCGKAFC